MGRGAAKFSPLTAVFPLRCPFWVQKGSLLGIKQYTHTHIYIYIYCIRFMPMISYLWRIELDWWVSWSCWRGKKDAGKYNEWPIMSGHRIVPPSFSCTCLNETLRWHYQFSWVEPPNGYWISKKLYDMNFKWKNGHRILRDPHIDDWWQLFGS